MNRLFTELDACKDYASKNSDRDLHASVSISHVVSFGTGWGGFKVVPIFEDHL